MRSPNRKYVVYWLLGSQDLKKESKPPLDPTTVEVDSTRTGQEFSLFSCFVVVSLRLSFISTAISSSHPENLLLWIYVFSPRVKKELYSLAWGSRPVCERRARFLTAILLSHSRGQWRARVASLSPTTTHPWSTIPTTTRNRRSTGFVAQRLQIFVDEGISVAPKTIIVYIYMCVCTYPCTHLHTYTCIHMYNTYYNNIIQESQ